MSRTAAEQAWRSEGRAQAACGAEQWPPMRLEMIDDPALDALWVIGKPADADIDCKCDPGRWPNGVGAVCGHFEPFSVSDRDCLHCDHCEACHRLNDGHTPSPF